jgi:hypothetical protein
MLTYIHRYSIRQAIGQKDYFVSRLPGRNQKAGFQRRASIIWTIKWGPKIYHLIIII